MKNLSVISIVLLSFLVACGPSSEEFDKNKATIDFLQQINNVQAEALAKIRQDSIEQVEAVNKARQDSIVQAELIAKTKALEKARQDSIAKLKPIEKNKGTFTDSRDGQTYKWVRIGKQVWMAENLNYKTSSGSWCYDNNSSNCDKYGRLYDWETAKKVCPSGWHLPTDAEWTALTDYLGSNAGSKLAGNAALWPDGSLDQNADFGTSGYSALPSGSRYDRDGAFINLGAYGHWWSASELGSSARNRYLNYTNTSVNSSNSRKSNGDAVRCIRD